MADAAARSSQSPVICCRCCLLLQQAALLPLAPSAAAASGQLLCYAALQLPVIYRMADAASRSSQSPVISQSASACASGCPMSPLPCPGSILPGKPLACRQHCETNGMHSSSHGSSSSSSRHESGGAVRVRRACVYLYACRLQLYCMLA
jgi:hypothetical protein